MRRYIIKSNCLTGIEKDNIKEQVIADIQGNESVAPEINTVNNGRDNTLKQSGNDYMKAWVTENEYNKLKNRKSRTK